MKILHLPTTVGGNPVGLSIAERKIGLESYCLNVVRSKSAIKYDSDLDPKLHSLYKLGLSGQAISLFATFLYYRTKFDIFHFNAGHTLLDYYPLDLHYLDLPFYPKNKKLIMTFNGSDVRQYIDEYREQSDLYNIPSANLKKQKRVKIIDEYCDKILAVNPDLLKFLPERTIFVPYTIAKWDSLGHVGCPKVNSSKEIRIVHAPSNRELKGTKYILEAITKLQKEFSFLKFILVENTSYTDALEIYKTADLVIDQLILGWYGALSVEVMKMGKPVMVYIRESDLKHIPKKMADDCLNSFINTNPSSIYTDLKNLITNRQLLSDYSDKALEYVYKWHEPMAIAKFIKETCY